MAFGRQLGLLAEGERKTLPADIKLKIQYFQWLMRRCGVGQQSNFPAFLRSLMKQKLHIVFLFSLPFAVEQGAPHQFFLQFHWAVSQLVENYPPFVRIQPNLHFYYFAIIERRAGVRISTKLLGKRPQAVNSSLVPEAVDR